MPSASLPCVNKQNLVSDNEDFIFRVKLPPILLANLCSVQNIITPTKVKADKIELFGRENMEFYFYTNMVFRNKARGGWSTFHGIIKDWPCVLLVHPVVSTSVNAM